MSINASTDKELVNIAIYLEVMAKEHPFKPAVIFPEGRDKYGRVSYTHFTFSQLFEESKRIAKGLEKYGLKKGTKAVLMVTPSLEFFALSFAMFRSGIIPVAVDPGLGIKNLKICIAEVGPEAFIGVPKAHVARVLFGWGKGTIKKCITVGNRLFWGGATLEEIKEYDTSDYKMAETEADDIAAIAFTSGSTGVPKGVVYTHKTFVGQVEGLKYTYDIKPGEKHLATFPLFAMFDPAFGMTTVIPDMDFTKPALVDPVKIIETIENLGVTHMFGSPALINRVGRYGKEHNIKLPSLKRVLSAGAPVPYPVLARFKEMMEPDGEIFTPYGATECLPVASISATEIAEDTKTLTEKGHGVCIGRAVYGIDIEVVKISDDVISEWSEDLRVPVGTIGEITVKGKNASREYFKREKSTELAKIYEKDGKSFRHRMGDLGYFDEKGRLWFCGRKSHRVVTKDKTLFTIPCEAIYNNHPDVYRSALVGAEIKGETLPVICIELEQNSQNKDKEKIKKELFEMAYAFEHTKDIKHILFHNSFPVDIRHNSKIFREKLSIWAEGEIK